MWTTVEVASALQLKQQLGFIDTAALLHARNRWQELFSGYLSLIQVNGADFATATDFYHDKWFNLRSGDALHLALASRLGSMVATLDRRMHEQARAMRVRTADTLPG